jgi:TolA-binding protein
VKLIAGAAQLAITREGEPARSIEARVQKDNVAALHVAWPKAAAAGAAEAPTPEGGAPGLARISRVLRSAPGSAEGRTDETAGAADSKLAETMLGDSKLAGHAPRDDAEALYLRAELAMQAHDDAAAIADLETLVRLHAGSALADTALLELARIRSTGGDNTRARQDLETLLARKPDAALAETAHHSLCKLQVEAERTEEALACLASFERTYPSSAHRQAVLRALAGLSERAHGCRAALDWIAKLAASYPHDPLARELEARRRQCRE